MLTFIVRRLLWSGALAVVITLITFVVFFLIPNEVHTAPGQHGLIEPTLQAQFNLHGSVLQQYLGFLGHVVERGDIGRSRVSGLPAFQTIGSALPVTASLVIGGTVFWLLLAVPIGLLSALRPRSLLDKGLMILVLIGISAHPLWLGLVLSYVFGVRLHLFPVAGYCNFWRPGGAIPCGGPKFWADHMILPWLTFALLFAALYARMIRASVLEALEEDYVRTAKAKGAGAWRVLRRHVFRNAIMPVVAMIGMDVGVAFGGALFIEVVYGLPGMGTILFRALGAGDLPVIMGVVLVVSIAVAVANLIADVGLSLIDPRLTARGGRERSGMTTARLRRPRARAGATATQ